MAVKNQHFMQPKPIDRIRYEIRRCDEKIRDARRELLMQPDSRLLSLYLADCELAKADWLAKLAIELRNQAA